MNPDVMSGVTADLLSLYDVKRWGVIRMSHQQSVAEHSFGVAIIAMELMARLLPPSDNEVEKAQMLGMVLKWALVHDMPEALTADIDGRFKRNHPVLREAIRSAEGEDFPEYTAIANRTPDVVKVIVKLADNIETISYLASRGQGARATDVVAELKRILEAETIPVMYTRFASKYDIGVGAFEARVPTVLHQIMGENYGYQFREKW